MEKIVLECPDGKLVYVFTFLLKGNRKSYWLSVRTGRCLGINDLETVYIAVDINRDRAMDKDACSIRRLPEISPVRYMPVTKMGPYRLPSGSNISVMLLKVEV